MEEAAHRRAAAVRLACAREIETHRRSMEEAATALRRSLPIIRSRADAACTNREDLWKIKEHLHDLEINLQNALSVKAINEEKHKKIGDCISTTKTRIEELERIVQDQKMRREEYVAVITQQSLALEAYDKRCNLDGNGQENIVEAISWYNRVLGFRTTGGDGVKFNFTNVNPRNAEDEFSFTIRLDDDKYCLLQCNPFLQDLPKLVEDLNQTNNLFEFVRSARGKFQELVLKDICQDISTTTLSSPPPTSIDSRLETVSGEFHVDGKKPMGELSSKSVKKTHRRRFEAKSPSSVERLHHYHLRNK